jgi:hypothetical protein
MKVVSCEVWLAYQHYNDNIFLSTTRHPIEYHNSPRRHIGYQCNPGFDL